MKEMKNHNFPCGFRGQKQRINPKWLRKQMSRPDSDERMMAFYESIYDAMITDTEDWETKGTDVMRALIKNDASELLIALCGWGPASLAKQANMMRGCAQYQDGEVEGTLMVDWNDGIRTAVPCVIQREDHMVGDFDYAVFTRKDAPAATIERVFVRFKSFEEGNEYDFLCVSRDKRDAEKDDDIFWYWPEEDAEGSQM